MDYDALQTAGQFQTWDQQYPAAPYLPLIPALLQVMVWLQ